MTKAFYIAATLLILGLMSCSKDDEPKQKEPFLKTITCTFPERLTNRNSAFSYDSKNRIKEFTFNMTGQTFLEIFSYDENGLITQIDERRTDLTTGAQTEHRQEFRYAGRTLNEYILDGTSYVVTYELGSNSYQFADHILFLDANQNLKRINRNTSNRLTIDYTASKGVFAGQFSQIASYILAEKLFIYYQADIYAFSQNQISGVLENDTPYTYAAVRDEQGNIVQTDVKNAAGTLVQRFIYTYELREVD